MGMSFIPHLLGQVEYDFKRSTKGVDEFALLCKESGDKAAQRHKDSIKNEMKRRHDMALAEKKRIRDEAEAKRLRKERRNALREAYKLGKMQECIRDDIVLPATRGEY